MISIQSVMTADHRRCDEFYYKTEQFVSVKNWDDAQLSANDFIRNLLAHFDHEESVLFPKFEEVSGMRHGPTEMMRHEHGVMRTLLNDLGDAIKNKDQNQYLGVSETMLIYMQQHNMKEEQMLYPMIDKECAELAEKLTENIRQSKIQAA